MDILASKNLQEQCLLSLSLWERLPEDITKSHLLHTFHWRRIFLNGRYVTAKLEKELFSIFYRFVF